MGINVRPNIVTNGLVLNLDAANVKSYPRSGTSWNDLSGNNNTGTLTNGPVYSAANGGSFLFDGVDDYVTGSTTPLSGSSFSIGCWIKPITVPDNKTYFGLGTTQLTDQSIHLRLINDTNMRFGMYSDDLNVTINSATGKWNYFVVTLDNNRLQSVYQNSTFINSRTATSFFIGNNLYFIGAWGTPGIIQNINAEISLLQIYNRALSPSEIQQNYNATKTRFDLI